MKGKNKLSMYLSMALLLFVFCLLPCGKANASDDLVYRFVWAEVYSTTGEPSTSRKIIAEAGQSFDLSPYLRYSASDSCMEYFAKNGDELKLKFTSSKPSVASVGKTSGIVTPKKAGTTKIKVTYKKKTCTCTLTVRKKGSLGVNRTYKKLNSAAKALKKYYGKKVTSKNIAVLIKKAIAYENQKRLLKKNISEYGFLGTSNKLVVPDACQVSAVLNNVSAYAEKNKVSSKIKIRSASGRAGATSVSVIINLKPTKNQIYIEQYYNAARMDGTGQSALKLSSQKATFELYEASGVSDEDQEYYDATCTLTKGSNNAVVRFYDQNDKPVKLQAGYDYYFILENGQEVSFSIGED